MAKRKKLPRNLKTFTKYGKRYRVVYSTSTRQDAESATAMYDRWSHIPKITAVYHDDKTGRWLVGVGARK